MKILEKNGKAMLNLKIFEAYNNESILIIVVVQKSYKKFFNDVYIDKLKKYSEQFNIVYQIFDNHIDGKNVDKGYLYDKNPDVPIHDDLYYFPNQKDIIEKRYNYNIDISFYKNIIEKELYKEIEKKEDNKTIKKGDFFKTKEETLLVYIGNNHKWIHLPKKLTSLLLSMKGKNVTITGGADSECLEDIFISAESLGVIIKRDYKFIYSASHFPPSA